MNLLDDCSCNTYCFVCWWPLAYCQCHPQPPPPIDVTEIIAAIRELREELLTTQEYINHGTEAKTASLFWLVGLSSFGIGISVMTIFAILWGRAK